MAKKKTPEIPFEQAATDLVALAQTGRPIASIGSSITGKEKSLVKLVRSGMILGNKLPSNYPISLSVTEGTEVKDVYTRKQLVDSFAEQYPRLGKVLLEMHASKHEVPKLELIYGPRESDSLTDGQRIEALSRAFDIGYNRAEELYIQVIEPAYRMMEEKEDRFSAKIKE
jgi:hypothetical protein